MPYRIKKRPRVAFSVKPNGSPVFQFSSSGFERTPIALDEWIDYTYDGNRRHFNTCNHYLSTGMTENSLLRLTKWVHHMRGWSSTAECRSGVEPATLPDERADVYVFPQVEKRLAASPAELTDATYGAYLNMLAGDPGRHMNVVRSAIELKDTKTTIKSLVSLMKWAHSHGFTGKLRLVTSCAKVAEAYLTYQFGIAPTVSDVKQFIKQLSNGQLRVRGVPRIIGKNAVVRAHYSLKAKSAQLNSLYGGPLDAEVRSNEWFGTNGVYFVRTTAAGPWCPFAANLPKIRATEYHGAVFARATKTIVYDGFDSSTPRRFAWSCPLGKTLWDLTPFSFLVDWFIDVGASIEKLDKLRLLGEWGTHFGVVWHSATSMHRMHYPIVQTTITDSNFRPALYRGLWNYDRVRRASLVKWHATSYDRTFHRAPYLVPSDALVPTFRWRLSTYQLSAGMALITSTASKLARGKG